MDEDLYVRAPTISGDEVVFVCEDDLWMVAASGGRAYRLTAGVAEAGTPRISPDGRLLAFTGREEGPADVYAMPTSGGPARRLTYAGGLTLVAGFDPTDGSIVFATDAQRPIDRERWLYAVRTTGGLPRPLNLGPAGAIAFGPSGALVLGRHTDVDPARWKRYRGGRVGNLWVDPTGSGEFSRLVQLDGNLTSPTWVGERVYFLSDHEGIGNVYSCTADGQDLRRHSDHDDYYARNLSGDGQRLVYHAGARLWLLDPADGGPRPVEVRLGSSRTQRNRQFVPADEYLDTVSLSVDGASVAITTRGKAFSFGAWAGPVSQHGEPDGVRYRLLTPLAPPAASLGAGHAAGSAAGSGAVVADLIAAAGDDHDQECLVVLSADGSAPPQRLTNVDVGRVVELVASPVDRLVAVTTHRNELLLVDLRGAEPTATRLDHSTFDWVQDPAWSADGRWLAYTFPDSVRTSQIRLARLDGGDGGDGGVHPVTRPVLRDRRPSFDPQGRYLYFIGQRQFDPVPDEMQHDLGFPLHNRVYAVTLRADEPAPFLPRVEPLSEPERPEPAKSEPATSEPSPQDQPKPDGAQPDGQPGQGHGRPAPVVVDLAGIERRVVPVPVPLGRYVRVAGAKDRVLFTSHPVAGVRGREALGVGESSDRQLQAYDLKTLKVEDLASDVSDFMVTPDGTTMLYRSHNRLRVVKTSERPNDEHDPGRTSGWVNLDRVKVSVRPDAEWRQMFREAWRLQRDHFWVQDMSGVDWDHVYEHYLPLVDRVSTRAELSDLLWEVHGELGTSHAYEAGGAYRPGPRYRQGFLGVDWEPGVPDGVHRIAAVVTGDVWDRRATSPLNRPGVNVGPGDTLVAVNGIPVTATVSAAELLANLADEEVRLTVRGPDDAIRTVTVRALADERPGRYRDWVEANRALVHERTGGRVGYFHVPDMGADGFAEFHRGFLAELDREGLIVDVRHNAGGYVSDLLLEKLARRRLGYDYPRWGVPTPYPQDSPRGPIVALTNERAGSDGDIFCHAFKQLKLGTVIGKRTWGGVIGIWPRHLLADGTVTTQPEFSFAFDDVGWRVENYGTDPDIEVDYPPQDYTRGFDPQLDLAIRHVLETLETQPAHSPNPTDRPRLGRKPLPPRTAS
jgi:tricorn protease